MLSWQVVAGLTAVYVLFMLVVTIWTRPAHDTTADFFVMNRRLGTFRGALSIAASWIWAPAVFICSQKAYEQGLPGIFWFTFPNILCFFVFVPIALRARKLLPHGYSMPDFLYVRFGENKAVHFSTLIVYLGYQSGAIVINALAGGTLLHILTGIPVELCIILMSVTALSYSAISGLRASVNTDVVQMLMILFIAFILVPWVLSVVGVHTLAEGLGGKTGAYTNIFDPEIAYSFGIAATLGLISGPIADQMFWQRAFAASRKSVSSIFMLGGIIFGLVPIVLSILGFVAAVPSVQSMITVNDSQMIGPILVGQLLPTWALAAFVLLTFAGLSSTLDSAFAAIGSLLAIDVYKRHIDPRAPEEKILRVARYGMILFTVLGTSVALLQPKLLWVFLIYGALASAMLVPVFYSLFSRRVTAGGVTAAVLLSIGLSLPLSIYANIHQDTNLIVLSALLPPVIGAVCCFMSSRLNKTEFDYDAFTRHLGQETWRQGENVSVTSQYKNL
jgi:Na+/proline symporter